MNQIAIAEDKHGGASPNFHLCHFIQFVVKNLYLAKISFRGRRFTWRHGNIFEHSDKALCNLAWQSMFPHVSLHHLLFLVPNHCSILLDIDDSSYQMQKMKYWRFEHWWTTLPGYSDQIKQQWDSSQLPSLHQ